MKMQLDDIVNYQKGNVMITSLELTKLMEIEKHKQLLEVINRVIKKRIYERNVNYITIHLKDGIKTQYLIDVNVFLSVSSRISGKDQQIINILNLYEKLQRDYNRQLAN